MTTSARPTPPPPAPPIAAAVSPGTNGGWAPTGSSSRAEIVALANRGQALDSPVEAYFEVANRCNSQCVTCPVTFSPQEAAKQLSLEEFQALVEQMPHLRRAVMQGIGEPLLNRDLARMIGFLKQRDVYVVFNTNAALLTRRRQVELIESGLDELRVSLDGSTPETYLRVRGIPAFERVVANVAEMVRTQAERNASTPRVSFWVTGMRENLPELPGVIDLAAQVGVREVYLQRMTWGFDAAYDPQRKRGVLASQQQSLYGGEWQEAERILEEAERRAGLHDVRFRGAGALSPRESLVAQAPGAEPWRACSRPLRLAYVTAQGNALPCCIAPFTDAPYESITLGNYLRDGVVGVWHGEAYQRFRERLYSADPPPSCRNCGVAWSL